MNISNNQYGNVDVVKLPQRLIMENSMAIRKDLLELLPLDVKRSIRFRNGGLKVLAVSGTVKSL